MLRLWRDQSEFMAGGVMVFNFWTGPSFILEPCGKFFKFSVAIFLLLPSD